jgi:hypothetical protein
MSEWLRIRIRSVSHKITWIAGSLFPSRIPLVFVVGYPKGGTTWVSQLLSECLNLPYPRGTIWPVLYPAVVHGHELVWDSYRKSVYVVRDGRDALVSFYFHLSRSLPEGDNIQLSNAQQKIFPGLKNKADIRSNLPAFIERQMTSPHSSPANWGDHIDSFLRSNNPNVYLLKYEDLLQSGEAVLGDVVAKITKQPADYDRAKHALDKLSFKRQTGRSQGDEVRDRFMRKGTAGDWRNHFTREAAEIFDHYCGQKLIELGYESDRSWVESCE